MLAVGTAAIIVGAGIAGVVSPAAIPPEIAARLSVVVDSARVETVLRQPVTDENFAVLERLAHWIAGYRMWESSPWLGIGAGNYGAVYGQYRLPLWEEPLGHAHNLYLNTLAETGLIGLAALIILWASLALWSWRRRNAAMGSPCAAVAAGVLGALTYLAVHSMVDVLFVQGIYISLALLVAALAARCAAGNDRFEMQLEARQG